MASKKKAKKIVARPPAHKAGVFADIELNEYDYAHFDDIDEDGIITWKEGCRNSVDGSTEDVENPKDAVGSKKVSMSVIPPQVLMEVALAMMEGAKKYGHYNWRKAGIRESVYYDAAMRHLVDYWEGNDIDEASDCLHLVKAIATLVVWVDAILQSKNTDDRPPPAQDEYWLSEANSRAGKILGGEDVNL